MDYVEDPLHVQIAKLCLAKVHINKTKLEKDISFFLFVTNSVTCQWLPQVQRVVAWVHTLTSFEDRGLSAEKFSSQCQLLGTNIHSLHLVAFFGEEYQDASNRNDQLEESAGMLPSFLAVPSDTSVSKQELVLQQCVQGSELNWENIELGIFTLDFLLSLVKTYYQPLKLLATIPSASLFHLLEGATKETYADAISIIERHLRPFSQNSVLLSNKIVCDLKLIN